MGIKTLTDGFWSEIKAAPVAAVLGMAYMALVLYVFWIGIEMIIMSVRL